MKNNIEQIPTELFSWLQSTSFNELSATQQETVLAYLSEQEYNDMYQAAKTIHTAAGKVQPKGKEKIKNELLVAFNQQHNKNSKPVFALLNTSVSLGKVAAVVLLMMSAMVWQYINGNKAETIYAENTKTDTLLVETKVPVTKVIYDTLVVVEKQSTPIKKVRSNPMPESYSPTVTDLHIAGTDELDKPYNQPKYNSLKNDTLVTKFGFVSL